MTTADHKTAAERARRDALDADLHSHIAAERGDTITAADQIDERDYQYRVATHHEHLAAAHPNTPGDDAINS